MPVVGLFSKGRACVCGLLHPEAVFVVHAVTRNHAEAHDGAPMMVLPLTVKSKEATFAVVSMTADAQLRGRDVEGLCDKPGFPPTPQITAKTGSHQNELLQIMVRMLKCSSEQPMAFVGGMGKEGLSSV